MKKTFLFLSLIFTFNQSLAAVYEVTSVADAGVGTLRQAIIDANASVGVDEVHFNLAESDCDAALVSDSGVCKIELLSSLPEITEQIVIDGTTQPQYAEASANVCATPTEPSYMRVELNSSISLINYLDFTGLNSSSIIKGLSIGSSGSTDIGQTGIVLRSSDNWIHCNHIGVNGKGDTRTPLSVGINNGGSFESADGNIFGTNSDGVDDVAERNVIYASLGISQNKGDGIQVSGNYFNLGPNGFTTFTEFTSTCYYFRQSDELLLGSNLDGVNDDIEKNIFGKCTTGISAVLRSFEPNNVIAGNWFGVNSNRDNISTATPVSLSVSSGDPASLILTQNWINSGNTGVRVENNFFFSPGSINNCFTNNFVALDHQGSIVDLDMSNNYWDAADGPSGVGPGSGGVINETGVGTVLYEPFLSPIPEDCYSGAIQQQLSVQVTGLLAGQQVVLQNDQQLLLATSNGVADFTAPQTNNTAYDVSVFSQPEGQTCEFNTPNSGIISFADVVLELNCKININLIVSGYEGSSTAVFSNFGDNLDVSSDGVYTISTQDDGSSYFVFIREQPQSPNQTCSFQSPASGTVSGAQVDIDVVCQTEKYNLNVNVEGLADTNTIKFNNNSALETFEAFRNGINTLTQLDDGSDYLLNITQQPSSPNQTCLIDTNQNGTINGGSLQVDVSCVTLEYDISVNITGLGENNTLSLTNGLDSIDIDSDGTNLISTLSDETDYDVMITTQPTNPNQVCRFMSANSGKLAGANVQVEINCETDQHDIYVFVEGLAATNTLSLTNGNDVLNVSSDGLNLLSTLNDGSEHDVVITTQPTTPNQTCSFTSSSSGISNGPDAIFVEVECTTNTYFIGGNVSGLLDGNYMVLQNNGGDYKTIMSNGGFIFDTPLLDENRYEVHIFMRPENPIQPCVVINNSATLAGSDIDNVEVSCSVGEDLVYRNGFE